MRMKKQLFIAMALLSLGVTSCKDDVTFDQETYDNLINKAFPVENVDPNHQWATVGTASVYVQLNGKYAGSTIKIYSENPIVINTPTLLASGTPDAEGEFNTTFSFLLSNPMIYVTAIDSDGYMTVMPKAVKSGDAVEVAFGLRDYAAARHRAASDVPTIDYSSMQAIGVMVQDGAVELTKAYADNEGNTAPAKMKISSGTWDYGCACLGDESGRTLYVGKGVTWNIPANTKVAVGKNGIIFLDEGAKIHLGQNAQLISDNMGQIIFMRNTEITDTDGSGFLYVANGTSGDKITYNAGIINVGKFDNNGGYFYNANQLTTKNYQSSSENGINVNRGAVKVEGNANIVNSVLYNNCKFEVTGQLIAAHIVNGNGAYLECDSYKPDGSCFLDYSAHWLHLGENAIMNVKGEFNTQTGLKISGPSTGNNFGIFQCKSIPKNQNMPLHFLNNLYVCRQELYVDNIVRQHYHDGIWDNNYYTTENWIELNWEACFNKDGLGNGQAVAAAYQEVNFVKDEDECSPQYGPTQPTVVNEKPMSMRYCFEDNFPDAGDYDFNDVVLTVTPTVNGKTLTLKVSLDAVGATKTIGAAIRLLNFSNDDLDSYSVIQGFDSPEGQGMGTYNNIEASEGFVPGGQEPNLTDNMVIVLFKDAHWAINPEKTNGGVTRSFYNTVKRDDSYQNKKYVDPATATYTLVFKDEDKAKSMLAEKYYDVFIVEPYNGSYWEVHTVGFKTAQVITPFKPEPGYTQAYGSNKPWAIKVSSDFQYPNEWQVIGKRENGEITGAYKEAGHSFAEWAENSNNATDWYKYPTSGLVYE